MLVDTQSVFSELNALLQGQLDDHSQREDGIVLYHPFTMIYKQSEENYNMETIMTSWLFAISKTVLGIVYDLDWCWNDDEDEDNRGYEFSFNPNVSGNLLGESQYPKSTMGEVEI